MYIIYVSISLFKLCFLGSQAIFTRSIRHLRLASKNEDLKKYFSFPVFLVSICKNKPVFKHSVVFYFNKFFVYKEHLIVPKPHLNL